MPVPNDKVIVIDKVEDDAYQGKGFKKVTDKAGETWKIKSGREDALKNKWHLLVPGKAIKLTMGEYQGHPFVANFEVVEDIFVEQAAVKVQEQVKEDKISSIESQVAAKIVAELWIAGKTDEVNPLVVTLKDWLFEKLGVKPQTQGKPPSTPTKPPDVNPGKPAEATKPFDLKEFMQEFTETRTILENAGQEKWKYDVLLARLSEMTGVSLKSMAAGINKLTNEQREALAAELKKDFQEAK